ncbi:MAG: class I SAM-dependent methyltransferase [Halioglobus sp.]
MGFYEKYVVPRFINCACGTKPIMRQREKVVPQARGTVLEIGIGTGLNLPFYNASQVDRVIGLDPSEKSWELAGERASSVAFDVEFVGLPGEQIPLEDDSVDTVMVTYSLCTIPDPVTALQGMARVLRPAGQLIFCEHGRAPDAGVVKWQDRINPLWMKIAGGCHLNRDIPSILSDGGFSVDKLEEMYLPSTPRIASYNYWGTAQLV